PFPLARLHVDRDDAVREQVVPRAIAAVLVAQSLADRNVDEPEIRIRGVRRPGVGLADADGADLRAVRPRVRAELAGLRNQIELPELLARVHVEAADEAGNVVQPQREIAVHRRVAYHDHAVDDDRRRAVGDLAVLGIDAHRAVGAGLGLGVPLLPRLGAPRRIAF